MRQKLSWIRILRKVKKGFLRTLHKPISRSFSCSIGKDGRKTCSCKFLSPIRTNTCFLKYFRFNRSRTSVFLLRDPRNEIIIGSLNLVKPEMTTRKPLLMIFQHLTWHPIVNWLNLTVIVLFCPVPDSGETEAWHEAQVDRCLGRKWRTTDQNRTKISTQSDTASIRMDEPAASARTWTCAVLCPVPILCAAFLQLLLMGVGASACL